MKKEDQKEKTTNLLEQYPLLSEFEKTEHVQLLKGFYNKLNLGIDIQLIDNKFVISCKDSTDSVFKNNKLFEDKVNNIIIDFFADISGCLRTEHFLYSCKPKKSSPLDLNIDVYNSCLQNDLKNNDNFQATTIYTSALEEIDNMFYQTYSKLNSQAKNIALLKWIPDEFKKQLNQIESSKDYSTLFWLLAPEHIGENSHSNIVNYRFQANDVYRSIGGILKTPTITNLIDQGLPINKSLKKIIGVSNAGLLKIREISKQSEKDLSKSIVALSFHNIASDDWKQSIDLEPTFSPYSLSQISYMSPTTMVHPSVTKSSIIRDSLGFFFKDIIIPVIKSQNNSSEFNKKLLDFTYNNTDYEKYLEDKTQYSRDFLSWYQKTIVGSRNTEQLKKSCEDLHRFLQSINELRHELLGDTTPWPALFPEWTSEDKTKKLVCLTGALDLLDEGRTMNHCVGGYASFCRTGQTHILSLRIDGQNIATLEMKLSISDKKANFGFGQFKARFNERAPDIAYDAIKEFKTDIKNKKIKPNLKEVSKLLNSKLKEKDDYYYQEKTLDLENAEKMWPVYRDNLLVGVSKTTTLKEWAQSSDLINQIQKILNPVTIDLAENSEQTKKELDKFVNDHSPLNNPERYLGTPTF